MKPRKIIGVATTRSEGREKVSGSAIYATDVVLPNMLWAKALRSPIPYGRIKKIDTSKAEALPGVRAVVTGADVKGSLIGRKIYDMPVLADSVVRFIGEKVAVVAAENEEIAEAAVDLIDVEYEELEPLLDPLEAVKPSATLLHPDVQGYRGLLHEIDTPSNVFVDMTWSKGDIEAGFRDSDLIVENIFTTQPMHQGYIEPHACVVRANPDGSADIWHCSKVPFALREQVATALRRPLDGFIMHPCYIGGCFGGKGDFMDVPVCYLLSLKSGRPVKMVMDYSEEFIAGNPRHAAVIQVKTGVKKTARWWRTGWISSTTAALMARSNRKAIWSDRRKRRGRTKSPMSSSTKRLSTPTRFPAVTCARRANRKDFSPTNRKWTWWRAGWVWSRSLSGRKT